MKFNIKNKFKGTGEKLSSIVRHAGHYIKQNSSDILFFGSLIGGGATIILTVVGTRKLDTVTDKFNDSIDAVHEAEADEEQEYTKNDKVKDLAVIYTNAGMGLLRIYAPAIGTGSMSLACALASRGIIKKRNAALASAAYTTIDAFEKYRKNVVEKYGEDVDTELRYGLVNHKVEETETDPETGKTKKSKKTIKAMKEPVVYDNYTIEFSPETSYASEGNMEYDSYLINGVEKYFNDLLIGRSFNDGKRSRRGWVFLDEIASELGLKNIKSYMKVVGWEYDPDKDNDSSDYKIDLRAKIINKVDEEGNVTKVIMLDPNIDGKILNLDKKFVDEK